MLEPKVYCAPVVDGSIGPSVADHEALEVDVCAFLLFVAADDTGSSVGHIVASVALARDPEVVACELRELLIEALHEQVRVISGAFVADSIVRSVLAVTESHTSRALEVKPGTEEERRKREGREGGGQAVSLKPTTRHRGTCWRIESTWLRWAAGCRLHLDGRGRAAPAGH